MFFDRLEETGDNIIDRFKNEFPTQNFTTVQITEKKYTSMYCLKKWVKLVHHQIPRIYNGRPIISKKKIRDL